MGISISSQGSFKNTETLLKSTETKKLVNLDSYGRKGVAALSAATPVDTGLAASSWGYDIEQTPNKVVVSWRNDDVEDGVNVARLLEYGHATKNGGWIEGKNYVAPAINPVLDDLANDIWKGVTKK